MITVEDCIALCGLPEEEVLAIAEHERLPEPPPHSPPTSCIQSTVRDMIVDDIRIAQKHGNKEHVLMLLHVLHHFLRTHPEIRPQQHPRSRRRSG